MELTYIVIAIVLGLVSGYGFYLFQKNRLKEEKEKIIKEFSHDKEDTGSPEVQVALLSAQIDKLAAHLGENPKDVHSRRGLLSLVSKRRRLLNYLAQNDKERYQALTR